MKKSLSAIMSLLLPILVFSVCAQGPKEISKTFEAKKLLRIETVSGDCSISRGDQNAIKVDVAYDIRAKDAFEPDFQVKANELKIKERWHGHASGRVLWKITVPGETEVMFSTASGDLEIEHLNSAIDANTASGDVRISNSKGEIEISTASGDIHLAQMEGELDFSTASGDIQGINVKGELDLSTASGDIRLRSVSGSFDLSCASGDIDISDLTLNEESSFSTASGDIELKLAESAKADLECSAASGDVTLDYNGNELKGFFEFTTKKHGGRIIAPLDFDNEEEFNRGGSEYVKKSFSAGGSQPRITFSTSSGNVKLKK